MIDYRKLIQYIEKQDKQKIVLHNVREYAEEEDVCLTIEEPDEYNKLNEKRICIRALNEAGYNSTLVDLEDLIDWLKKFELLCMYDN